MDAVDDQLNIVESQHDITSLSGSMSELGIVNMAFVQYNSIEYHQSYDAVQIDCISSTKVNLQPEKTDVLQYYEQNIRKWIYNILTRLCQENVYPFLAVKNPR